MSELRQDVRGMSDQVGRAREDIAQLSATVRAHIDQQRERTQGRDAQVAAILQRIDATDVRVSELRDWRTRVVASAIAAGAAAGGGGALAGMQIPGIIRALGKW